MGGTPGHGSTTTPSSGPGSARPSPVTRTSSAASTSAPTDVASCTAFRSRWPASVPATTPSVRAVATPPLRPPASGNHDDAPARVWTDAFCVGNGRHGALAFGDPYDETVIINHHALTWPDAVQPPAGGTPPLLAGHLEAARDLQ